MDLDRALNATDKQLEAEALIYFAGFCLRMSEHPAMTPASRKQWKLLHNKVLALTELRKDYTNG